jgi:two-component system response regulator AdeR
MALILVAEDEPQIADMIRLYLEHARHRVLLAADGPQAIQHHQRLAPDLALLDVKLPGCDGFAVLEAIRETSDIPVLMVTALGDTDQRLAGLAGGADDYIVKPFDPRELVARVEAVMRRVTGTRRSRLLHIGRICIDMDAMTATIDAETDAKPLDATPTQLRLFAHMARQPGRVFSRSELAETCLGEDSDALERTVDSHLSKLRRRLAVHDLDAMVEAVRSMGYRAVEVS